MPDGRRFTSKSILKLTPKKEHHNTTFTCQAQNTADRTYRSAKLRLAVKYAPKVRNQIMECINNNMLIFKICLITPENNKYIFFQTREKQITTLIVYNFLLIYQIMIWIHSPHWAKSILLYNVNTIQQNLYCTLLTVAKYNSKYLILYKNHTFIVKLLKL